MAGYTIERTGARSVIAVTGDLTATLVPALQASLKQELAEGARELVFDLGAIEALDSSGIGLLIATCNSLTRLPGQLTLVNLPPPILQLLHSMRLVSRLNASGRDA